MLREDATLQRIALLPRHRADVQRVGWLLVRGLLQLPAVHELDVGHGRPRRFPRILILEAAPKSGQHVRKIIVQRGRRTLSRLCVWVWADQSEAAGYAYDWDGC
jgi:hypothetical protein